MANATEDRNKLWKLLTEAFKVSLLTTDGHGGSAEEAIGSAKVIEGYMDNSPERLPFELEREEKVYRFRVVGVARAFQICFNPAYQADKETEYFSRGCTLVRELLNVIFEKYNKLLVKGVKYNDDAQIEFNKYVEGDFEKRSVEDTESEAAEEKFRYRVGFWVTVKDQIDKRVTNKAFPLDMPVEFAGGRIQYRSDIKFSVDEGEDGEPDYDEIVDIPDGTKEAIVALSKHLQQESEKERIFRLFMKTEGGELKRYIDKREEHAQMLGEDAVFRYNVVPLTIYLDRIHKKSITYRLSHKNGANADFRLEFDPTEDGIHICCPNCGAEISPGKNVLVLAYGKVGRKSVIACKQCTIDLGHTGYYLPYALNIYLKEDVLSADHEGKSIILYREDTFRNELDRHDYSKESGRAVQYYFLRGQLHESSPQRLFPSSQVHQCKNCGRTYAVTRQEEPDFEKKCIAKPEDDTEVEACVKCAGTLQELADPFRPKRIVYQGEVKAGTKDLFFCNIQNGSVCSACGNVIYMTQKKRCKLCGEVNCGTDACISGAGICRKCHAAIGNMGVALSGKEGSALWKHVKSMIPLQDRRGARSRRIFKRVDKNGIHTLYYVVLHRPSAEHVYCFEKSTNTNGRHLMYILLNESGKYATVGDER